MNAKLLRSKMALFGDNNGSLSIYLGISPQRLSAKINETNGAEFTQGEIAMIKTKYNLTPNEIDEIFFAKLVS